jgi:HSP20 family protein
MSVENPTIHVTVGSKRPDTVGQEAPREDREKSAQSFTPPIDIHEGPEGLVLEADLPGAIEKNLRIELAPEAARLLHEEYRLGDYQRSFILGDEVDRDRITAELTNGVLRLFLPKADRKRTRRIEIKT